MTLGTTQPPAPADSAWRRIAIERGGSVKVIPKAAADDLTAGQRARGDESLGGARPGVILRVASGRSVKDDNRMISGSPAQAVQSTWLARPAIVSTTTSRSNGFGRSRATP